MYALALMAVVILSIISIPFGFPGTWIIAAAATVYKVSVPDSGIGWFTVGVMFALNQPQDKDSNSKIVAYFANHSHRVHGVIGFFVFLAGLLFLLVFLAALRERLLVAPGAMSGSWRGWSMPGRGTRD